MQDRQTVVPNLDDEEATHVLNFTINIWCYKGHEVTSSGPMSLTFGVSAPTYFYTPPTKPWWTLIVQ